MTIRTDAAPAAPNRRLSIAVAIAFGLLYAYDLFEAVTNLVGVPTELARANDFLVENDLTPVPVPWAILIANLLLPAVAFALAWWLGRRRSILIQSLLYLVGLAVVAAISLTLTSLV